MATKTKKNTAKRKSNSEMDSAYFLKLVLYLILGFTWVKISKGDSGQIPLPLGLVVGLIFTHHERFQIDRKIEYAVLLIAMLVGFWVPLGLYIVL